MLPGISLLHFSYAAMLVSIPAMVFIICPRYFGSFNLSRNCLLGRKEIICRLVMVIDSPVLGLRPRRGDLSRTFKLPNWTNLIDFPLIKVFFSVAKTVSTISAAFRWETPSFSVIDMANSFRVTLFFFIFNIMVSHDQLEIYEPIGYQWLR